MRVVYQPRAVDIPSFATNGFNSHADLACQHFSFTQISQMKVHYRWLVAAGIGEINGVQEICEISGISVKKITPLYINRNTREVKKEEALFIPLR